MVLGMMAAGVAILYALVKYLAVHYVRTLQGKLSQTQNQVQKTYDQWQSLEARAQTVFAQHESHKKRTENTRIRVEGLYERLSRDLPAGLLPQLDRCQTLFPLPDETDIQTIQELGLGASISEGITQALSTLTLLIVQAEGRSDLIERCQSHISADALSPPQVTATSLTCVFGQPAVAYRAAKAFGADLAESDAAAVRAALCAGLAADPGHNDPSHNDPGRLAGQLLKQARQIIGEAPDGALVLNGAAANDLKGQDGIVAFDDAKQLYQRPWTAGAAS